MNTQHTPGPWHVSKRNPQAVIESGPRGNHIARMGVNLGVCSQREAEANAHLISAAPELLAVLKAITADGLHCDVVPHLHEKARAAIVKAQGGGA